jgi:hypothetical protein
MDQGRRLLSRAVAEFKRTPEDLEIRELLYEMLGEASSGFDTAVAEADAMYEVQRARVSQAKVYVIWSRELYRQGTEFTQRESDTLERARSRVEEGLRLPHVPTADRADLEALRARIDRALESAPAD